MGTSCEQTKQCSRCSQRKPLSAFSKNRGGKHGRYSYCKPCNAEYAKQRREIRKQQEGDSYLSAKRRWHRQTVYGLSESEYDKLHTEQGGVCAICGKPETRVIRGQVCCLAVDHCHDTGKVRGLLCQRCNVGIGYFYHDVSNLERAILYLKEHEDGK